MNEYDEAVLEGDEIQKVDEEPYEPSGITPEAECPEERDRLRAADDGEMASVAVAERRGRAAGRD